MLQNAAGEIRLVALPVGIGSEWCGWNKVYSVFNVVDNNVLQQLVHLSRESLKTGKDDAKKRAPRIAEPSFIEMG